MRKKIFILALLISSIATAQQSEKSNFWNNVRFGGGLGLNFGATTNIAVSPMAIYDFNNQFSLGLGVGYQYSKNNNFTSNVFSGSILSLYNPISSIQLSAEFEQLFVNQRYLTQKSKFDYPALYLGVSYQLSRSIALGARYDVLYDKTKRIYSSPISPIIRVFF